MPSILAASVWLPRAVASACLIVSVMDTSMLNVRGSVNSSSRIGAFSGRARICIRMMVDCHEKSIADSVPHKIRWDHLFLLT